MKPEQALQVLNEATQPAAAGRLSRADYVAVEQALVAIKQFIEAHAAPPEKKE